MFIKMGNNIWAKAIRTKVVPIKPHTCTMAVPISNIISKTVMQIACATGIGYRHDRSMRFSHICIKLLIYHEIINYGFSY